MTGRPAPSTSRDEAAIAQFAADVEQYLSRNPRQLPSRYFYDPLGSALFDAICHLPWYPVTRAESRLIEANRERIHALLNPLATIVELGPGNGQKLKLLLEGAGPDRPPLDVHLVDVSALALDTAVQALDALDSIRIVSHVAEYDAGLQRVASEASGAGRMLVLFLGSNIGNFDPPYAGALLANMRESLSEGDALLLGTDLVKPARDLLLAYDDPLGVTAAFNRNLLVRINTQLAGDFDVAAFDHEAIWNAADSRIEMHLVARSTQRVRIAAVPMEFTMRPGERIWTESSYKYRSVDVEQLLRAARFDTMARWVDDRDGFMLTLAQAC